MNSLFYYFYYLPFYYYYIYIYIYIKLQVKYTKLERETRVGPNYSFKPNIVNKRTTTYVADTNLKKRIIAPHIQGVVVVTLFVIPTFEFRHFLEYQLLHVLHDFRKCLQVWAMIEIKSLKGLQPTNVAWKTQVFAETQWKKKKKVAKVDWLCKFGSLTVLISSCQVCTGFALLLQHYIL